MSSPPENPGSRHQVIHGLKWSAIGKTISQLVSWAITLVVIRLLAPADYGLMAVATMVIAFISLVNEFGLGAALVQAKEIDQDRFGAIFGGMLLLSTALAALLALSSQAIASFFDEQRLTALLMVASLQFVLSALVTVPEALLKREMNFKRLALVDVMGSLAASFTTLAFAWSGWGVWALVFGMLAGAAIRALFLQVASPVKIWPNLRLKQCKGLLNFGGNLTASRLIWQFLSQADILIGAKLLSKDALGLYSVSLHLASLPMQKTMSIINQVIFSAAARNQDAPEHIRKGLSEGLRLMLHLAIPTLCGLAAVAPEFVLVVLGPQWADSTVPLQLVALAIPIRMVTTICSTTAIGLGYASIDLRNTTTGAIVMPICFVVGAQWGGEGLAMAWLVGVPVVFLFNFRRLSPLLGIAWFDLAQFSVRPLCAAALMSFTIFLARYLFSALGENMILFILIMIGATTYLLAIFSIDLDLQKRFSKLNRH